MEQDGKSESKRKRKTEKARVLRNQEGGRTGVRGWEEGGYGCCEIIAYSLNIKAWRSASSYSVDGGRRGGIARRAYLYTYTTSYVCTCMHACIRMHAREREREEESNAT